MKVETRKQPSVLEKAYTSCFSVALRPQKPSGFLGMGAQDGHLHFHTVPELWSMRGKTRKLCVFTEKADVQVKRIIYIFHSDLV